MVSLFQIPKRTGYTLAPQRGENRLISVILYGRNDSYGYNLHKRAALSLNCIAEVLDDPDDEILFVDYNTPDDFPTFPEAIRDTLTARARRVLRILRVRPAQHAAFAGRSRLVALEPVARNVALRRVNPANRWVLSTNTDMILVPRDGASLSAIAGGLADAFYHLPRFEVPESLWEGLDRMDAAGTIARLEDWGRRFHLNEIVHHHMPALRFDALGDFQLMLRADLLRIHGFDERMLLGYHVDSNIAQRLAMLGRAPSDILARMYGYHCDHTRQVTPAHRPGALENDPVRFIHRIPSPEIPDQAESWGLAGETIEELRLDTAPDYAAALEAAMPAPMTAPTALDLSPESYDRIGYDAAHVLPFLLDSLASFPRDTRVAWAGCRADLRDGFAAAWAALGFVHPPSDDAEGDVFVFDFGLPALPRMPPALAHVIKLFRAAVAAEQARIASGRPPRRFICVNAIHNRVDGMVRTHVGVAKSPLATRIRQGFVLRAANAPIDILPLVPVEEAGEREVSAIRLRLGERGHVFGGPQLDLAAGRYRLLLRLEPARDGRWHPGPLKIEALAGGVSLARRYVPVHGLAAQSITLRFEVKQALLDAQTIALVDLPLTSIGRVGGRVTRAVLTREGK